MTGRVDIERILDAYLRPEPETLADRVIECALQDIESSPQARRGLLAPRRFPRMNTFARGAAVAAIAIVALAGAAYLFAPKPGVGGPSTGPTAVASVPSPTTSGGLATAVPTSIDTSTWVTFTSKRHGLSIDRPATWGVTDASAPWRIGAEAPPPPNPMLDVLTDPDTRLAIVAVSQLVPDGMSAVAWVDAYEADGARRNPSKSVCWLPAAELETATVDGQPAWIHGGVRGCGNTEALVFAGGRVYEITAYPSGTILTNEVVDRALYDAILSTVHLDPGSADDTPAASPGAT